MLRSLRNMEGYTIAATDGDIGGVANFLFDDERWTVRHLVAQTGGFFSRRSVLISPMAFREADWSTRRFHVQLTMEQVRQAPAVDVAKAVSRQHESDLSEYYRYPSYWGMAGIWGMNAYPASLAASRSSEKGIDRTLSHGDFHLRSVNEVHGYRVHGTDDELGSIHDFMVDDLSWELRYLVVDTRSWWPGMRVLVAPSWSAEINWAERAVYFRITRDTIHRSPVWHPDAAIDRAYETRLHDHYGRPIYWPMTLPTQESAGIPPHGH